MAMIETAPLPWVVRVAVPAAPAIETGLTVLTSRIAAGLPHAVPLDGRLVLGLVAPTGLARFWQKQAAEAVVSAAGEGVDPFATGTPPLRLLLRDGQKLIGVAPLVTGSARFAGMGGTTAPAIRLRVTAWRVHAGTLVGAGDYGSFVTLAWAPWGRAADAFAAPVARGAVLHRLAAGGASLRPGVEAPVDADAAPGSGAGRFVGYGRSFADG